MMLWVRWMYFCLLKIFLWHQPAFHIANRDMTRRGDSSWLQLVALRLRVNLWRKVLTGHSWRVVALILCDMKTRKFVVLKWCLIQCENIHYALDTFLLYWLRVLLKQQINHTPPILESVVYWSLSIWSLALWPRSDCLEVAYYNCASLSGSSNARMKSIHGI